MATKSRPQLEELFKNGNKPSQQDFKDWIDSFVHLNDPLDTVVPRATQPEAEAGIDNNKVITPLTLVNTLTALVRLGNLGDLLTDVQTEVNNGIAALVDSSPGTLDTLNELANALGDDPNFATTVTNSLANKLNLAGGNLTGELGLSGNKITNLGNATANGDVVNLGQLNTLFPLRPASFNIGGWNIDSTKRITVLVPGFSDADYARIRNVSAIIIPDSDSVSIVPKFLTDPLVSASGVITASSGGQIRVKTGQSGNYGIELSAGSASFNGSFYNSGSDNRGFVFIEYIPNL